MKRSREREGERQRVGERQRETEGDTSRERQRPPANNVIITSKRHPVITRGRGREIEINIYI